jgi:hypothetical protein
MGESPHFFVVALNVFIIVVFFFFCNCFLMFEKSNDLRDDDGLRVRYRLCKGIYAAFCKTEQASDRQPEGVEATVCQILAAELVAAADIADLLQWQ